MWCSEGLIVEIYFIDPNLEDNNVTISNGAVHKTRNFRLSNLWYVYWAKMVKYHLFLKFLATEHYFGNYWGSTTFSGTRVWWARVPSFLIHRGTMTWKAGIKIFRLLLEHLKLEYWLNSTRVLHTRVPSVHLLRTTYWQV